MPADVVGIAGVTNFRFQAEVTNVSGALRNAWDFGDGTTSTAEAPTHVFPRAQRFTVGVGVADNRTMAQSSTTVEVRRLSGRWEGRWDVISGFFTFDLIHTGSTLSGTYRDDNGPYTLEIEEGRITDRRVYIRANQRSRNLTVEWFGTISRSALEICGTGWSVRSFHMRLPEGSASIASCP